MSAFSNPQIASIDDALAQLEPTAEAFALANGFALARSNEGSLNVPRWWLQRKANTEFQEIGLIISSPMSDRLASGFYPEIPCTIYVSSQANGAVLHSQVVAESVPFRDLAAGLPGYLSSALESLSVHQSRSLQA